MRTAVLSVAFALASACATVDPERFDSSLRAATFDRFAREIDLQWAHERKELAYSRLATRHRDRAIAARTPAEFRRVLVDLLLDLRDPHATLDSSLRSWNRIALGSKEVLDDALPEFHELVRADGTWWIAHRPPVEAHGTGLGAALVASMGAVDRPPRWLPLLRIDGVTPQDSTAAEQLLHGPLLSTVRLDVRDGEHERVLAVPRNGLTYQERPGLRVVLPPRVLAGLLGTAAPEPAGSKDAGWSDLGTRARALAPQWRGGQEIRACKGAGLPEDLAAWRSGDVGYLRVGTFEMGESSLESLRAELVTVLGGLHGCRSLIVDLLGNAGGNWWAMGCLASSFLDRATTEVPHEGRLRTSSTSWFVTRISDTTTVLPRTEVDPLHFAKVLVLVDQDTASAAEILAAILRCKAGATLIGETTVGAETWVHRVEGPDGSTLSFGLPGGMTQGCPHFQGAGLRPDVRIELSAETLQREGLARARREHRHAVRTAALEALGVPREALR